MNPKRTYCKVKLGLNAQEQFERFADQETIVKLQSESIPLDIAQPADSSWSHLVSAEVVVCMTNYNYGQYLVDAVSSVYYASHKDVQIVIVDDLSTDNSISQIETVMKLFPNVSTVFMNENVGVAGASNAALCISSSTYFMRVDSDDRINPKTIRNLENVLDYNPEYRCVACDYYKFGNEQEDQISARKYPISCGIMYVEDALKKWGGYNINFRHREEEELRKRVGADYCIGYLNKPFYGYRMHSHNKTKEADYIKTII